MYSLVLRLDLEIGFMASRKIRAPEQIEILHLANIKSETAFT
jgi:hypothetical protein